jgi:hypothetical protein
MMSSEGLYHFPVLVTMTALSNKTMSQKGGHHIIIIITEAVTTTVVTQQPHRH